jgi:PKHD-type hydroxylase
MLLHIPNVLDAEQLRFVRERLDQAGDAEYSPIARELGDVVVGAIERNPLFISAVLPNQVYPPLFNRYEDGMHFGSHVDGAVRVLPNGVKLRTDVSATLFISDPDDYDGGELVIEDNFGVQQVKLPAGDMIVYPATSLHQITPVTRGVRVASFFWVQSLVRSDTQRALLFDMDTAIQRLNATQADDAARRSLVGCYHNLLRTWSET